jgi:hypothetical protein
MESSNSFRFPKLKGSENYESWRIDITSALKAKGLWGVTTGKLSMPISPPNITTTAEQEKYANDCLIWEDKNDRACGHITFSTEEGPRVHIGNIDNATQMWFILKNQYEQSDITIVHLALRELTRSKQSDFKFIQDYADSLKRVVTKCAGAGQIIPDWQMDHLFLLGLNEGLEPYVFGLIQSAKISKTTLSIDDMTIALVDHDKRSNQEESFNTKSMVAKFDKKSKSRNNSKPRKDPDKTCSHCELKGHNEKDCWFLHPKLRPEGWKPRNDKKDGVKEGSDKPDSVKNSGVKIVRSMRISFACRAGNEQKVTDAWWIDTGAEDHVCYDKDLFDEQSYRKITGNSIITANNVAVAIVGKGSMIIDILLNDQPTKIRLNDVYHCPELHYNLMSVGQVESKEYTCSIKNGRFLFTDPKDDIVLTGSRNNAGAYFVDSPTNPPNSRSMSSRTYGPAKASWRQWHKRLAHMNMADVKRLANMSTGIDVDSANSLENQESPESVCEACAIGKQHRTPSRRPHTRATKIGELVHTDLAGGGNIPKTDGGARYVATMIDDYSQYTTTYLLGRKSELKTILRNYLKLMKTRGTPVQRLRSDNGGEYAGHQTIELLEEHGVK